jgi:ribosomal protein L10
MTALEMEEIAQIPTLEVLRGKFVNIINSPIQRFVIGLNEINRIK